MTYGSTPQPWPVCAVADGGPPRLDDVGSTSNDSVEVTGAVVVCSLDVVAVVDIVLWLEEPMVLLVPDTVIEVDVLGDVSLEVVGVVSLEVVDELVPDVSLEVVGVVSLEVVDELVPDVSLEVVGVVWLEVVDLLVLDEVVGVVWLDVVELLVLEEVVGVVSLDVLDVSLELLLDEVVVDV
jgi:hypothetical protein